MNDASPEPLLFAPTESRALGSAIADAAGLAVAPLEERAFEQGEFKMRPLVSVRDRTAIVVQTLADTPDAPTAQRFVRLLFLLLGLRDAGARHTVAVVPYLAYARKDRRTQPRDPVTTRHVAQLLEAARADRLLCLDAHDAAALDNAFRVPVDHLTAAPLFVHHAVTRWRGTPLAIASPDVGGVKRAQIVRELLQVALHEEVPLLFVEKRRSGGVVGGGSVVGDASGRTVLVIDDLCATGGTLIRAATALRQAGATAAHAAVTHLPSPRGLAALAASGEIAGILATDSVGPVSPPESPSDRVTILSCASLIGAALRRMREGKAVAPLLRTWPPPED